MPISYNGAGVIGADDVYVIIKDPTAQISAGGATFQGAVVGGAQWGAVNVPYYNSAPGDLFRNHGFPLLSNPAPLVQEAALFLKQSPSGAIITVRVTDGSDTAATGAIEDQASNPQAIINFSAKYTGSFGNRLSVRTMPGSVANTTKLIIYSGNSPAEVYDRIPNTGSAAYVVNAINNGNINTPPSNFVVANAGPSAAELSNGWGGANLSGGSDGLNNLNAGTLQGQDGSQGHRTGMYALRKQGMDVLWLAGCSDSNTWLAMTEFAKSETAMAIGNFPIGTTVQGALNALQTSAANNPYFSVMLGHAVYYDTYLQQNIYLPSASVLAGDCCSLRPSISPGNKRVAGILGTDHTYGPTAQVFSDGDETNLQAAGINFISLGIPAAPNSLGIRHGKNTSSNPNTNEIAYTRKTNDIARALSGPVLGQFVDLPQSTKPNDPLREAARNALNGYFAPQVGKEIDDYNVTLDLTNNTPSQIRAGTMEADVLVAYLANTNRFVINVTAGQSVVITVSSLTASAA